MKKVKDMTVASQPAKNVKSYEDCIRYLLKQKYCLERDACITYFVESILHVNTKGGIVRWTADKELFQAFQEFRGMK